MERNRLADRNKAGDKEDTSNMAEEANSSPHRRKMREKLHPTDPHTDVEIVSMAVKIARETGQSRKEK